MNRKHDVRKYRHIVEYIREKNSSGHLVYRYHCRIYSGEPIEQFQNTVKAMEEFSTTWLMLLFILLVRARLRPVGNDDVPIQVKKERLHALSDVFAQSSRAYNEA